MLNEGQRSLPEGWKSGTFRGNECESRLEWEARRPATKTQLLASRFSKEDVHGQYLARSGFAGDASFRRVNRQRTRGLLGQSERYQTRWF
jgi:hypothetical protein